MQLNMFKAYFNPGKPIEYYWNMTQQIFNSWHFDSEAPFRIRKLKKKSFRIPFWTFYPHELYLCAVNCEVLSI